MQIKQFTGGSLEELLPQIRAEIGDDAVILETKRVVRGGIGGFFGREGIEVTAAEGVPDDADAPADARDGVRSIDLVDDERTAEANEAAVLRDPPVIDERAAPAFSRHLSTRLSAALEAEDVPQAPPAPRPPAVFAPGPGRTEALIESAREAMRQASARGSAARAQADAEASATAAPPRAPRGDRVLRPEGSAQPTGEIRMPRSDGMPARWEPRRLTRERPAPPAVDDAVPAAPPAPPPPAGGGERAWAPAMRPEQAAHGPVPTDPSDLVGAVSAENPVSAEVAAPAPAPAVREVVATAERVAAPGADPLAAVRAELTAAGVEPDYADALLAGFRQRALPFLAPGADVRARLSGWIAGRLPLARDLDPTAPGRAVAFVGQTGVGKTSAACKLAAGAARAGQRVTLVLAGPGSDHAAVGLAAELGLEVVRAPDAPSLAVACRDLADRDLVVVDTAGRSHRRADELQSLADLLEDAGLDEVHLVVPAGLGLADMGDLGRRFAPVGVTHLTLTKLDETGRPGNLVNHAMRSGLPIGYLADGATVPDDLRPADGVEIAGMLLP